MKRWHAALVATIFVAAVVSAAEPIDETVVAQIEAEASRRSEVMGTLSWLSDAFGPRLTGSPSLRQAAEWARDRLTKWGLVGAALEPYGSVGRGWTLDRYAIEMVEPQFMRITGYPRAWSPSTPTPIAGTPIVVQIRRREDYASYHGKLRGAIVMSGRPGQTDLGFRPEANRLTDEELQQLAAGNNPAAAPGVQLPSHSYWEEDAGFQQQIAAQVEILKYFGEEGVAALITPSSISEDVRVDGFYDRSWHATYPAFVVSREHYGRIVRMLDRKLSVKLSLSLTSRFIDKAEGFNVVAEIPGTDPALKSEVVMLGGHLDSWHAGTGATDNAAGCAVALEAVRILEAIGAKPRRTIRVALWSGEEQGYFGSIRYVEKHFADMHTMVLRPEHAKLSAYFNLDGGSGRIRGVELEDNEAVRPIFEAWLAPFHALGATTLSMPNTGGTDHMPFDAVGLPAFQFIQDPINYDTRAHHSSLDVYEEAVPDDLQQASAIMASFVYHAAMRDEKLPRKPLPAPRGR